MEPPSAERQAVTAIIPKNQQELCSLDHWKQFKKLNLHADVSAVIIYVWKMVVNLIPNNVKSRECCMTRFQEVFYT